MLRQEQPWEAGAVVEGTLPAPRAVAALGVEGRVTEGERDGEKPQPWVAGARLPPLTCPPGLQHGTGAAQVAAGEMGQIPLGGGSRARKPPGQGSP